MSYPGHALSTAEKLARQRQAAAVARSHAHMLQVKVVVVCGCAIAGAFGFALYRSSPASAPAQPPLQPHTTWQGPSTVRVGEIQLPHEGEQCRHFRFDNTTGVMGNETMVPCTSINVRPPEAGAVRAQAIMNAFRFK